MTSTVNFVWPKHTSGKSARAAEDKTTNLIVPRQRLLKIPLAQEVIHKMIPTDSTLDLLLIRHPQQLQHLILVPPPQLHQHRIRQPQRIFQVFHLQLDLLAADELGILSPFSILRHDVQHLLVRLPRLPIPLVDLRLQPVGEEAWIVDIFPLGSAIPLLGGTFLYRLETVPEKSDMMTLFDACDGGMVRRL